MESKIKSYKGKKTIYRCYELEQENKPIEYKDITMYQINLEFESQKYVAVYGFNKYENNDIHFCVKIFNETNEELRFFIDNYIGQESINLNTTYLYHACSLIDQTIGEEAWYNDTIEMSVTFPTIEQLKKRGV
ncbi:hypothetical protein FDC62_13050 [Clostridium botulinum]|uniref:hypothetical protein n=1 Tax=Clostridium botulinum TaxID=1491 RepID=UPI0009939FFA|nr:hypothetical protein [Clostridium botulinum]NFO99095.1 hypothetical protein [Clostridium botulinum]OOV52330.1 hypothetical protein B1A66_04795 [Clostridium botulinum D/C]OOV54098.1 hypothetical protein B0673_11600 [Clostridium botulinum D/C]OOV58098.1 hypothetical protein B1A67_03635 [Clostridium botulinum D/C]